ncbi:DNA polymerase III subunit gamma and tau [Yonghaparkia sp. Root332]|uniref:DNA polymerase III subunit gamma and tau n=1 Tax=Yonghaparkia sp. Root332 TaxID=1736516 RepID=UPI0006F54755|nr:DNA polymerase III subunit gamma and tau [Yonghaparkia sp. Root332]KQV25649.1 DNA polymerase III subunit gamma/tau [Yonghaparkia sp. Root332]
MATALYRRYRPETFAELIGQSHVTDPLRAALRSDRVNHAYLFSGPRGCGKTTSARILARCLNCAEGPTDTPCGVCPSCVELSRAGGGSLDVVEIDAASHGGVDDARDLRERAVFAPARDRYKIFIIDEAHMVTSGGFNALLKIVEEPPEHIKFIFATTEPEKVIGTIRSRTHHYPFRLVPPAQLLDYVAELSASEGVTIAPGVLPLVVRAGGGSVRDTLSLLDQLIAGSDDDTVTYERAVALLGYTHGSLLDEVVSAIAARDANAAFHAIDRVIQTGQDPRRFVDDLLERLRDLIVVQATAGDAGDVLRGIPADDLARMHEHAALFAPADLSKAADVVNRALTEMTGATSPRLHLELMMARVLVTASPGGAAAPSAAAPRARVAVPAAGPAAAASAPAAGPAASASAPTPTPTASPGPAELAPAEPPAPAPAAVENPAPAEDAPAAPAGPLTLDAVRAAWPAVLERIQAERMSAWTVVYLAEPVELEDGDVLTLAFTSESDANRFKERTSPADSISEHVRSAIQHHLGVRVKLKVRLGGAPRPAPSAASAPAPSESAPPADPDPAPAPAAAPARTPAPAPTAAPVTGWNVVPIPGAATPVPDGSVADDEPPALDDADAPPADDEPADDLPSPPPPPIHPAEAAGRQRYGEAVVREVLGARFIGEEMIAPAVSLTPPPREDD